MIHLTQLQHDGLLGRAAEADRLTLIVDRQAAQIAGLVAACNEASKVHHSDSKLGMQLRAAVGMTKTDHTPRRPLAELLEREAAVVGLGLDAQSLEQGEPA